VNQHTLQLYLAVTLAIALTVSGPASGQESNAASPQKQTFGSAVTSIQTQLEDSIAELDRLRERVAKEKIPLDQKLNDLESELLRVRQEFQQTSRLLDSRTLDLSNLRNEIKTQPICRTCWASTFAIMSHVCTSLNCSVIVSHLTKRNSHRRTAVSANDKSTNSRLVF